MKKRFVIGVTAMALTIACAVPAYAGEWKKNTIGWWWQSEDGSYPTDTGMWLDGNHDGIAERYYFNKEGYMLENVILGQNEALNNDGAWTFNGEVMTLKFGGSLSSSGIPAGLSGIYYGKVKGEDMVCYITIEDGKYFYETDFGFGPMPSFVGNNTFDDEDTTFVFDGGHLKITDKVEGNAVYDLIKQ